MRGRLVARFILAVAGVNVALLLLACSRIPTVRVETVPTREWLAVSPDQVGWSAERVQEARAYSEQIGSAAVMVVVGGKTVAAWGETDRKVNVASVRKSLLNALIGMAVETGQINLDSTLEQLGIDDEAPPLTTGEKRATVADLLTSRSGVYHVAEYEAPLIARARPRPASYPPGRYYYYNNWDFNALGTIFEQQTGARIGEAFSQRIARPLQMQDFQPTDVQYAATGKSIHPAYPFRMTTRDMARFGLLYLRNGRWSDRQIIASDWVARSTDLQVTGAAIPVQVSADGRGGSGYGYLWWVANEGRLLPCVELPPGTFTADGIGGHYILVVPAYDLVIVHQGAGDQPDARPVPEWKFGSLVHLLLDAAGAQQPSLRDIGC